MIIVTMRWEKLGEEEFEGEIKNSVGPLSVSDKIQAVEPDCLCSIIALQHLA